MKSFTEYKIKFLPFNADLVTGVLWTLEIEGIVENEDSISVYSGSNKKGIKPELENLLESLVKEGVIERYLISSSDVENRNWNEEWEKGLKVIEISDRITIKPTFREYENSDGKIVIEIDPKMSFGTGEHQTTRIMLGFLEKYIKGVEKVLDVGSGTAVLSIASIMLGAESAVAFDINEWAFENGIENVRLNGLDDKVDVRNAEITEIPENNFDMVLANINTHIILSIKDSLAAKVKSGGYLFLSGLLNYDEEKLIKVFQNFSFEFIEKKRGGDWSGLVFRK